MPCCLSQGSVKHDFLDIYITTFLERLISEIHQLSESSFFGKCLKFNTDLNNAKKKKKKNAEKVFCF